MLPDIPFSTARLDGLLDESDIDVVIVTSKHNILEDTIAVTPDGYEALGEGARGWNRIPS